jgi:2-keto-4-pentenoate hydratase/2-oxohepta-3-ene-1,7-dioic acid hydratase in catechol pathway
MRFVTYLSALDGTEHVGLAREGKILGLRDRVRLIDIIVDGRDGLRDAADDILKRPLEVLDEAATTLRAPIPVPPAIRDFIAFEGHVVTSMAALGRDVPAYWYQAPAFYFSNPAAVRGARDPVEIAPGSNRFDYELEVAAVIGAPGTDIPVAQAADHIVGLSLMCDWSARDLQAEEMTLGLGPVKGKDTATTIGPYLVTLDELEQFRDGPGFALQMHAEVNGRPYSAGSLADLRWSFEQMISYASRGTTLRSGDVLGSGTVSTGCILELSGTHGPDAYPWLQPGDRVDLTVEQLGQISVDVLPARDVIPFT